MKDPGEQHGIETQVAATYDTVHAAEVAIAAGDTAAIKKLRNEDFWIRTVSAKKFYPMAPHLNQYDIADIAHAIAHNNRYNGHMDHAYSVGQHSVLVSEQVLKMFDGDEDDDDDDGAASHWVHDYGSDEWMAERAIVGLQALLHDATEAYMPDMPSPIKLCLPDFMEMEEKIKNSIMDSFDLPQEFHPLIEEVDKGIRGSEIKWLFTNLKGDDVWAEDIYHIEITPWPVAYTKQRFLDMFNLLESERYGFWKCT